MDKEYIEGNKDIYIIETDFKDKNIKDLIKELILGHVDTIRNAWIADRFLAVQGDFPQEY